MIGILGGGQLAKMLVEASEKLGITVAVYSDSKECPAYYANVKQEFKPTIIVGGVDRASYRSFLSQCSTVIFESEFIDTKELEAAAESLQVTFLPPLSVMARFQDKLEQKNICKEYNLPTAPWIVVDKDNIESSIEKICNEFSGRAVFKWSRLGYDGKGNFFLKDISLQKTDLLSFITSGMKAGGQIYAEKLVPFTRELAIVCSRSIDGSIVDYPVIWSEQENGICLNVRGPATAFGVSNDVVESLKNIGKTIGEKGAIVGTYAVEAFEVNDTVMINEIAPRVHNTGHYTQKGCKVSQFENHMRAVSDDSLEEPQPAHYFGMRNILGPSSISKDDVEPPQNGQELYLHWYHKKGTRPGRKLGHINIVASSKEQLEERFTKALQLEKKWTESL